MSFYSCACCLCMVVTPSRTGARPLEPTWHGCTTLRIRSWLWIIQMIARQHGGGLLNMKNGCNHKDWDMCPEQIDALSSRWLPLILLFGAPPPHPDSDMQAALRADMSLHEFGDYILQLATWTNRCRVQYMEWEGIEDPDWGLDYNRCKREAFDKEFINWAYTLKREEYDEQE